MARDKSEESAPKHPPIPGDLPYREPPVIEGKAEEVHETSLEPDHVTEPSTNEHTTGSMDELRAAVENALDSDNTETAASPPRATEPGTDPFAPPREAVESEEMPPEPQRRWPVWPLALAALVGLLPGLAALWLALESRQDDPVSTIAALRSDVGRISGRVDAIEKRPDSAPLREAVAAADKKAASAETLARQAQVTADRAAEDAKAAASTIQNAAASPPAAPVAAAAPAPPVDLSPLHEQIGDADRRLGAFDQKLGSVDARLAALQTKIDQPKTETRAPTADKDTEDVNTSPAALAVVAQSLVQALPRGAPFTTELAALKSLKADPAKVAALEPLAGSGAPTARALADRFRPIADEIAKQDQPREASFFERIMQSATHLVRVRSAGEKQGSDPAALASQIQAALDRGDLARAHDIWTKLPDSAKARSQDWARALEARLAADNAAQSLASDSIARLAKPRS